MRRKEWYLTTARAGNIVYDLYLKARDKEEAYQEALENALERAGYVPALFLISTQKLIFF